MIKMEALIGLGKAQEAYTLSTELLQRERRAPPGLLYHRARALYLMDNLEGAMQHLRKALQDDPDNSQLARELKRVRTMDSLKASGNAAFKAGKHQEAIEHWTEALKQDSNAKAFNAKLYCNRAAAYSTLSQHQKAVADCNQALALDGKYLKAYERRAENLFALGGRWASIAPKIC